MTKQQNQLRIKNLYRMLLEMATGNLAYRLSLSGCNDELDQLVVLLNQFAEKMQKTIANPEFQNEQYQSFHGNDSSKQYDTELIQKVLDYIQTHLEEPLPSSKEMSKMFGTNEFYLKDSFRKMLKTSIYQFYNDERLKKAHLLIEETEIPLKEIAFICGFNDYTNFYKAFKKKFNLTPREIKHNSDIKKSSEEQ